jgi:hypothetical protein
MTGDALMPARSEHYLANPVMRASEVMAELARLSKAYRSPALAAE